MQGALQQVLKMKMLVRVRIHKFYFIITFMLTLNKESFRGITFIPATHMVQYVKL